MSLAIVIALWASVPAIAGARGAGSASTRRGYVARSSTRRLETAVKVAVQPFEGPNNETLRTLIVRIVRGQGFRVMTSLPRYEGTGQYPSLARDHRLKAFVTAGVENKGSFREVTFLVWNGLTGSVLGRWTASAPMASLSSVVDQGFWQHLGPALRKARVPVAPGLDQAAPMRIDASSPTDQKPLAEREKPRAR